MNQRKKPVSRNHLLCASESPPRTVRQKKSITTTDRRPLNSCSSVTASHGDQMPAAVSPRQTTHATKGCTPERICSGYSQARWSTVGVPKSFMWAYSRIW